MSFSWAFNKPGSVRRTSHWLLDIPWCHDLFFLRWHWHGVLFFTMNGKVKLPVHIGKLTLDSSYLKTYTCTKGKLNYLLLLF